MDVESCNDEVPDSGSELATPGSGSSGTVMPPSSMHNSNSQPGKLDGILYRTGCVLSQKDPHPDEHDVSTNVTTASSSSWPGEAPTQAHISGGFPVVRFKCPILLESKIYIQNISLVLSKNITD